MPLAILVALVLSGGVSIAAENAAPGDMLYPVKVGVNEEVRGALMFSSEAQAKWHARQIERRLEEAEDLKARGELDAAASAQLQADINESRADFDQDVEDMRAEGEAEAAAEVKTDLHARIESHADINSAVSASVSL